jgi:hypothetical protein
VAVLSSFGLGRATPNDHAIVFKAGQTSAYAEGQFSGKFHEVYFSFHAVPDNICSCKLPR